MQDRSNPRPWQPEPFSVAVLDSDEFLADTLCGLLREGGFSATAFYDLASLAQAHRQGSRFDAYVLDYLADWSPQSHAMEDLVAAIRAGSDGAGAYGGVPIFMLGNQAAPERVERLAGLIMQYRVRYVLKPLRAAYLARRIREAVADRAGL